MVSTAATVLMMLTCVKQAPLGFPVVPLVYMMYARSSGPGASGCNPDAIPSGRIQVSVVISQISSPTFLNQCREPNKFNPRLAGCINVFRIDGVLNVAVRLLVDIELDHMPNLRLRQDRQNFNQVLLGDKQDCQLGVVQNVLDGIGTERRIFTRPQLTPHM